MSVELGHFAMILAFALSLAQTIVPLWGVLTRDPVLIGTARPAAFGTVLFVFISYIALTYAYVQSDFSVANVFANSHSAKPLLYKISGVWSNHEGSMLLWILILVIFAGLLAWRGKGMPERLLASVLAVQGAIASAFLIFVILTSNPFLRLNPAPPEGEGINPILADPGLAIHPPLLYMGYVGFSVAFSFAVGALIHGRIDAVWARFVRPWTLFAWCFLTLGIAMGSYWAYYELGWGGWWFWDPVENASLMPWLLGTALLHSTVVMEKRDALKVWTILLSILTFSFSLLGTFIVRSGLLTSVHSFASDPSRGVFILAILVFFIGGSLALFAWRAPMLKQGGIFAPVSREGALVINNLFLGASTAAVLIGTLYPLFLEAVTGDKISVGAPFFNLTAVPLFVGLLLVLPVGHVLAWKRGDLLGALQRLYAAFAVAIIGTLVSAAIMWGGPVAAPLGIGLGLWLIFGTIFEIVARSWRKGLSAAVVMRRAVGLPLSAWGAACAHAGIGVTVIGVAATAWGVESIATVKVGEQMTIGRYTLTLERIFVRSEPSFREDVALFTIKEGDREIGPIETMRRVHVGREMPTTEAGIVTRDLGQIYISANEFDDSSKLSLRAYWKPLVTLIWIGSIIMTIGGALSLLDRRARIGVAVKRVTSKLIGQPA